MTRLFDFIVSLLALLLLSPLLIIVALIVRIDSKGPILFKQKRVGRYNCDFTIYKFRSMQVAPTCHQAEDPSTPRITQVGKWIRKTKIDELPQLFNVLKGDMSIVGPRPLIREQVELYFEDYKPILSIRPGLTNNASLLLFNEGEILKKSDDPQRCLYEEIIPYKIKLNLEYLQKKSFCYDISLIFKTIAKIFSRKK